jgi:POT family proton-dependent oligopeptide transporter
MVTKLSPRNLVSTVMGVWFLATAFSQLLAAIIAQFTKVPEGAVPPPIDTVRIYGDVFGKIAIAAMASAAICFLLVPLLKWWMHEEKPVTAEVADWQSYNAPGEGKTP